MKMSKKIKKISKFPIQQATSLVRRDEHHPRRDEGVCCDELEELKDVGYGFVATKLPSSQRSDDL